MKKNTRDFRDLQKTTNVDIGSLVPIIGKVIDGITDPVTKEKAKSDLLNLVVDQIQNANTQAIITNEDNDQTQINVAEIQNSSIFVSGWRPFIGWICAIGLCYQFLLVPIISWILLVFGIHVAALPSLDSTLWQLVFAMLGLGGLHTYEKAKGLPREHYRVF